MGGLELKAHGKGLARMALTGLEELRGPLWRGPEGAVGEAEKVTRGPAPRGGRLCSTWAYVVCLLPNLLQDFAGSEGSRIPEPVPERLFIVLPSRSTFQPGILCQLVCSFWSLLEGLTWGFTLESWSSLNWLVTKFFPLERKEGLERKIHSRPLDKEGLEESGFWSRCRG